MKKLLLIAQYFPPTNIVGALRPYRMVKHLCKNGWQVSVVANEPKDENARDYNLLEELSDRAHIYFLPSETPFTPSGTTRYKTGRRLSTQSGGNSGILNNPIAKRIIGSSRDIASRLLFPDVDVLKVPHLNFKIKRILNSVQPDIILTTSPPHSIHMTGLNIREKYGLKWIADFRDPWDYYPQKGHCNINNQLEKYWKNKIIRSADLIISSSNTYTSILSGEYKDKDPNKFVTITNTYNNIDIPDTSEIDPNHFVVTYTGIFYPEKDPFTFFRALNSWFESLGPDTKEFYSKIIRIQLIGSYNKIVQQVIRELKLEENVIFIDRIPHLDAIRMTKNSDMLLISTGIGNRTRPGWTPSKLYEYLGCQIPILAVTREGEIADIIRRTKSGYVITQENPEIIWKALEAEIAKKFKKVGPIEKGADFNGTENYEESYVMGGFVRIVNRMMQQ